MDSLSAVVVAEVAERREEPSFSSSKKEEERTRVKCPPRETRCCQPMDKGGRVQDCSFPL